MTNWLCSAPDSMDTGSMGTDRIAGFGGSVKRGLGRHVMADTMKPVFRAGRATLGQ